MTRASTVPGLPRARAADRPERELLRFEGESATYAGVEERSNLRAARTHATFDARQEPRP